MFHIFRHRKITQSRHKRVNPIIAKAVLVMAVAEPLMVLPQVYEVWVKHQTAGVSLATWGFMFSSSIIWLMYGLSVKEAPVITSAILWATMESMVFVGVLISWT